MTTSPILLLAPAANMTFVAMPSGTTYTADQNGLVVVTNGSVADEVALISAGCQPLELAAGILVTGAATLANLYSQDASDDYTQYTIAQVFDDSTSVNNGFWLKTGSGTGS